MQQCFILQLSLVASLTMQGMPLRRKLISLATPFIPTSFRYKTTSLLPHVQPEAPTIRVLQFNMLADGLSGLRDDLGAFSRAKKEYVDWAQRKDKLLFEILQYDPDVITLQECDHYYDFFLPELSAKGYDGIYAPKPAR